MITAENNNVKLTLEQLQQIETFQKRKAELELEVNNNFRSAEALKGEVINLEKNKAYLQGLNLNLQNEADALSKKKEELQSAVISSNKSLEENAKKHQEMVQAQSEKHSELDSRENALDARESELQTKNEELNKSVNLHNQAKEEIAKKKALIADLGSKL